MWQKSSWSHCGHDASNDDDGRADSDCSHDRAGNRPWRPSWVEVAALNAIFPIEGHRFSFAARKFLNISVFDPLVAPFMRHDLCTLAESLLNSKLVHHI